MSTRGVSIMKQTTSSLIKQDPDMVNVVKNTVQVSFLLPYSFDLMAISFLSAL